MSLHFTFSLAVTVFIIHQLEQIFLKVIPTISLFHVVFYSYGVELSILIQLEQLLKLILL